MERPDDKIRAVLFDFDGVIADTEPENAERLRRFLAEYGVSVSVDDMMSFAGLTDLDVLERYASQMRPSRDAEALLAEFNTRPAFYETGDIRPEEGLPAFLSALRERGIRTAVVSSTPVRLIVTALNRMSMLSLFDVVIGGDMVRTHKPSPEGYLQAMAWLDADAADCVVIEDSRSGIRAGKAAGAYVIGYTGTGQSCEEADVRIAAFGEAHTLEVFLAEKEEA